MFADLNENKESTVSKKKYYRTTFKFIVLSEKPLFGVGGLGDADYSLSDIEELCNQGANVGFFGKTKDEALDGKRMAAALAEAGVEPAFFELDESGKQVKEVKC